VVSGDAALVHLRGASADVVVDVSSGAPTLVHWGAPLGAGSLDGLRAATARPVTFGALDVVAPLSVVPEHGSGYPGRPGLLGHRRGGTHWSPRFVPAGTTELSNGVVVHAVDAVAGLRLHTRIELDEVLRVQCTLVNEADTRYLLDQLAITLPLPAHAAELLGFVGRWTRELHPVREPWLHGARLVENRTGRTSHEHPPLVFAGEAGFGEWRGEVWGVHLAWSGNHVRLAERLPDGRRLVQAASPQPRGASTVPCGPDRSTPRGPARCCSTPGKPSTSTTTSTGCASWHRLRPALASSGSCSTTAGSVRAATTAVASATGRCRPRCTRRGSAR
jgi:alpha-galactosidase